MSDRRKARARSGRHGVTADSGMEYVNDRFFLIVTESIEGSTEWFVFEPNHEPL
jgi:hypothetical protein